MAKKIPEGFEHYIDAWNNDDLPDGAWWGVLEEGVEAYNKDNGTKIDPNDGVHEYLRRRHEAREQAK